MRIKIRHRIWTIREAVLDNGNAGESCETDRIIEIDPRQSPKNRLDTLIHELLHAVKPAMPEKEVIKVAAAIRDGLWKDGWRRRKK